MNAPQNLQKRSRRQRKLRKVGAQIAQRAASAAQTPPILAHLTVRGRTFAVKTLHLLYIMPNASFFAEKVQPRQQSRHKARTASGTQEKPPQAPYSLSQANATVSCQGFIMLIAHLFCIYGIIVYLCAYYAKSQRKSPLYGNSRCVSHSFCIMHYAQFVVQLIVQNVAPIFCICSFCPATYENQ